MKKIFTILSLIPSLCFAQKIDINITGGGALNRISDNKPSSDFNKYSPFGSLSIGVQLVNKGNGSLSVGAFVEGYKLSYSYSVPLYNTQTNMMENYDVNYKVFNPAINFGLYVREKLSFNKSDVYFGLNGGVILGGKSSYVWPSIGPDLFVREVTITEEGYNALTFGIHFGYAYNVTNRIYLNAQTTPKFIKVSAKNIVGPEPSLNTISIPLSIGIGVKL